MDYNKLSYVLRSKNRQRMLIAMDKIKMPSQLKKELKMEDSNVARTLRDLKKEGIVKCLTPNQKMGRLYTLTPVGEKIRKEIAEESES